MAEKIGNVNDDGTTEGAAAIEDQVAGLEVLDSEWEEMDLGDGKGPVTMGPMRMRQVRAFMKEAAVLLPELQKMLGNRDGMGGINIDVNQLASVDTDAFFRAIAIAADIPQERLDELMPDAYARVVAKVFAANMDFFAQKLPEVLTAAVARVGGAWKRLNAVGRIPSSN